MLDEKDGWYAPQKKAEFGDAGLHDLFHPESIDLKAYPSLEHIDCTDTIVKPGEIIYYPAHWWHQTLNLDTPTISMAGRRIDALNYDEVARGLKKKCSSEQMDVEKRWPGAAPILKEKFVQILKDAMKFGICCGILQPHFLKLQQRCVCKREVKHQNL